MAANRNPIFIDRLTAQEITILPADTTTAKDLISAVASVINSYDGMKVTSIACTSDDTVARVVQLLIHDGTTAYLIGSKSVPALSGTDGSAPAVDILDAVMMPWLDSEGGISLPAGYKLQAKVTVTVTAAKTITLVALGGIY